MELLKIVDYTKMYKSKDGSDKPSTTYYLVLDNPSGNGKTYIAIQPHFYKQARDWHTLDLFARKEIRKATAE